MVIFQDALRYLSETANLKKGLIMHFISALALMLLLSGCSTTIDQDTKLYLKGPKAEVKRTF